MNQGVANSELIELSKAAAKVAGVPPSDFISEYDFLWLHEDSARCFELMCQSKLEVTVSSGSSFVRWGNNESGPIEFFINHDGNKEQATRVAILKAIVAIGEQK